MKMTDEKLYKLCKTFGARALLWRRKFIGLLPEVYRRKLYEKKDFSSIFEFAAKLAGVGEEQVRRTLNLEKRFENMPILKTMLETGKVSINKLARVASIATPENENELAEQAFALSQSALETLVRDEKSVRTHMNPQQNLENATDLDTLNLSQEVTFKLLALHNKGIDINALLLKFLEQRENELSQEKERLAAEAKRTESRYIPTVIKKIITEEHGTKCSIDGCAREAEEIHHTQRFSLARKHDPRYLAPLCKDHHAIAHSIDGRFQQFRQPLAFLYASP